MVNGKFIITNNGSTIGYGHDLTDEEKRNKTFEKGLSEEEATELLLRDLDLSFESVKGYVNTLNQYHGYNIKVETLTEKEIIFLIDFRFNRGGGLFIRKELKDAKKPYSSMALLIISIVQGEDKLLINTLKEETRNRKGKYYEGLELRRLDEFEILKYGDYRRDYDVSRGYK